MGKKILQMMISLSSESHEIIEQRPCCSSGFPKRVKMDAGVGGGADSESFLEATKVSSRSKATLWRGARFFTSRRLLFG